MRLRFWRQTKPEPIPLVCYTRAGCCLCERAERVLARLERQGLAAVAYVSIEGNPALTDLYGTRIPVVTVEERVLAEGKVSEVWLRRRLAEWQNGIPAARHKA